MANTRHNQHVKKYRDTLRMAGLRPVQLWVPDTSRPGFEEECLRQSQLVAASEQTDSATHQLLHNALADTDGWTA